MTLFGLLIAILVVGVPVAWFVSAFQGRCWVRLLLGCLAIIFSFGIAVGVGSAERLNSNAWFGVASKTLIDTTITELEAGNQEGVLRSLKALQQAYSPTYENRARYDVLVEQTVAQMRTSRLQAP
jgi:hypothetical protein